MLLRSVVWTLHSVESPAVERGCTGCKGTARFRSTGRFRVNANGRKVDVWLVYRCESCDTRWNRPIYERCAVSSIDRSLLERFLENDAALAREIELDIAGLRRSEVTTGAGSFAVTRSPPAEGSQIGDRLDITMELAEPVKVRLDRLLAQELGLSRTVLSRLEKVGQLTIEPMRKRALRRPVLEGQRVVIDVEAGLRPLLSAVQYPQNPDDVLPHSIDCDEGGLTDEFTRSRQSAWPANIGKRGEGPPALKILR